MSTPLEVENLRPVFSKIMKKHQLRPEDVVANRARKDIFNTGSFECECGHTWESKFSWITFDLIRLEIVKRWKMLCQECHRECYPRFAVDELEQMFEKAVTIYLGKYQPTHHRVRRNNIGQPHIPELCEKCEWGAKFCWEFLLAYGLLPHRF